MGFGPARADAASGMAIEATGLTLGYRGRGRGTVPLPVLSGLDLNVARGEFLTILGPSGCGKSTFLRVVADLLPPLAGTLSVLGRTPAEARSRREIAFVFQDAMLLPWRTVRRNVELPLEVGVRHSDRTIPNRADEWLGLVGLTHLADRYPDQLSGGQRQRVAIARALQSEPAVLLMDEPFGALDEITRDRLNDELLAIWRRTGVTVVFVTHSVMEAAYLGSRVLVLAADPGRIRALIDLRGLKDAEGRCRREDHALQRAVTSLRRSLADEVLGG